jgi:RsiW-degrading membrane proteinase PrsW (M82 family)
MSATAPSADLAAAQLAAIDASGWGHRVRIFQPRNLCSWLFLYYLVLGAIATFRFFRSEFEAVQTAFVIGSILFAIYTIPWIFFLRHVDRWSSIPTQLLVAGAAWGGLTATLFIALPANGALLSIYSKVFGTAWAADWAPAFTAPINEEWGKGIGILLLMFIAPKVIRSPFDGFIPGAFLGLGFQIAEDVLYAVNQANQGFGADQVGAAIQIVVVRSIAGLFAHAFFSAIFGAGLVYLVGTMATRRNIGRGIGLMALAMVVHGTWDGLGAIAGVTGLNMFVTMGLAMLLDLAIILIVGRLVSDSDRAWMGDLMAPEVARGTITDAELRAPGGTPREYRSYTKSVNGHRKRKQAKHVLEAARDLAGAISLARAVDTPEVVRMRAEVARVRGTTVPKAATQVVPPSA